ncbi:MAG: hypothetical protein ABL932_01305 [Terricaulis sp.]
MREQKFSGRHSLDAASSLKEGSGLTKDDPQLGLHRANVSDYPPADIGYRLHEQSRHPPFQRWESP